MLFHLVANTASEMSLSCGFALGRKRFLGCGHRLHRSGLRLLDGGLLKSGHRPVRSGLGLLIGGLMIRITFIERGLCLSSFE